MNREALACRVTVRALVAAYAQAEAAVVQSFAALRAAEEAVNVAFGNGSDSTGIHIRHGRGYGFEDPKDTIEAMRRSAWRAISERLEIRKIMSVARAAELDRELEKGALPEITEATVSAFVLKYAQSLEDLFTEAVREIFNWLRPSANGRAAEYKTNRVDLLGPKVVIPYMVDWTMGKPRVNYNRVNDVNALERVFRLLDGAGTEKGYYSDLYNAMNADSSGETAYFTFKAFRNGNVHIAFKRLDLVERVNQIAGGMTLSEGCAA